MLVILAVALVAATVAGGLAITGRIGPAAERIGTIGAALLVNSAVLLAAFWLLTARARNVADLLPGVLLAAAGLLVLQAAGGWYIAHVIDGATATYGAFAFVIGLLSWFWLGSHLLLLARRGQRRAAAAPVAALAHRRARARRSRRDAALRRRRAPGSATAGQRHIRRRAR